MSLEKELAEFAPAKDTALTIGVFDGVHRGHRYLISEVKEKAKQEGLLSGVVTFRQHPLEVLAPGTVLPYLTTIEQKIDLLKKEGVDIVVALTFTKELAALSAEQFIGELHKRLRMKALVVGPDFALGKGREGDAASLKLIGERLGFSVTQVTFYKADSPERVSSTAIRRALADGNMEKVTSFLGHYFTLQGKVVAGHGRGVKLGFPTVNLQPTANQALPPEGVYASLTHIANKLYNSVTNIGRNPTFNGAERTIETHIIGFTGDLYGKEVNIDVVERLRGEEKFKSVEDLKKQIAADINQTAEILSTRRKL